jgi:hypothetical protein
MSDLFSHLKARYALSVLRTAAISSLEEARHLVGCLGTERATPKISRTAEIAERNALAAILILHERFADRSVAAVAAEWKHAGEAVRAWIDATGEARYQSGP